MKARMNRKELAWRFGHYWVAGVFLAFMGSLLLGLAQIPGAFIVHLLDKTHSDKGLATTLHSIVSLIMVLLVPFIFGWLLHKAVINLSPLQTLFSSWLSDAAENNEQEEQNNALDPTSGNARGASPEAGQG